MATVDELLNTSKQGLDSARTDYLASIKGAPALESALSNAIKGVFSPEVKQLSEQRGQAAEAYYNAPAEASQKFSNIFDPNERSLLRSQYIGSALRPYITQTSMLGTLKGSLNELIGQALRGEQARMGGEQAQYGMAQDTYQSALGEFWKEREFGENQRQFEASQQLQRELAALSRSASGSGKQTVDIPGIGEFDLTDSQALNFLTSQQEKFGEASTVANEAQAKLDQIQSAIDALKGGIKTGPVSGALLDLRIKAGQATPAERQLRATLSEIGAKKLFELGGKVLPAQEMSRLQPFIPDLSSTTEYNIDLLENLKKNLNTSYTSAIQGIGLTPGFQPYGE
jgi:hypothetical protein